MFRVGTVPTPEQSRQRATWIDIHLTPNISYRRDHRLYPLQTVDRSLVYQLCLFNWVWLGHDCRPGSSDSPCDTAPQGVGDKRHNRVQQSEGGIQDLDKGLPYPEFAIC